MTDYEIETTKRDAKRWYAQWKKSKNQRSYESYEIAKKSLQLEGIECVESRGGKLKFEKAN